MEDDVFFLNRKIAVGQKHTLCIETSVQRNEEKKKNHRGKKE